MKTIHFAHHHSNLTPCGHMVDRHDIKVGSVSGDLSKITCKECKRFILKTVKTPPEAKRPKEKIEPLPKEEKFSFFNCNDCSSTSCRVNSQIDEALIKKNFLKANFLIKAASCKGHKIPNSMWKLGILALEHPQGLQNALSQFPFAKAILKINLR